MIWPHTLLIPYMVKPNQSSRSSLTTWSALSKPRSSHASSVWCHIFKNQHAKLMYGKCILINIFQNVQHKFLLCAQVSDFKLPVKFVFFIFLTLNFTNIYFSKFYNAHDMSVLNNMALRAMCKIAHMLIALKHVVWTQSLLS